MLPILLQIGGLSIGTYGVSKALAALAALWLLARDLKRVGLSPDLAQPLTFAGLVGGFAGAKLYYLAEHAGHLSVQKTSAGPDSPGTAG